MNLKDVKKQAVWELELEQFEEAVEKEKQKLSQKKCLFPYRIKLINLNERKQ